MEDEKTIWQGHSSQVVNLPVYLLCGLAFGALIGAALIFRHQLTPPAWYGVAVLACLPLLVCLVKFIQNKAQRYEVTTERIRIRRGIFSRRTEDLELYRVQDYVLEEPFFLRLFHLGNIVISTTENSSPTVVMKAIPEAGKLRDEIRRCVEACRDRKRVRITELEQ